jgi:hypothetical protein
LFDFSVSVNLVQSLLLTPVNDFINTRHYTGFGMLTKPVLPSILSWYQSLLANALRSCFSSSFGCSTARVSYAHTAHTGSALRKLHKSFPYSLLSFSTIIRHLIFTKNPTLQQPEPEKSTHELLCLHPKLYLPVSTAKNDAQTNSSPSSTNVSSFSS